MHDATSDSVLPPPVTTSPTKTTTVRTTTTTTSTATATLLPFSEVANTLLEES